MTKPTGRPRGRPKTKEYVTLMARVDIALADEVKRYASLHRQPISVVIRDALTLLMDEYPCAADRSGPHRLAAHEFLSDRYESPLDTLLGETDSAEVESLLSDTNEGVVETILSDTNRETEYASDTKDVRADIPSDSKAESAATHVGMPTRGRSRKASDTNAGTSSIMSDAKAAIADVPQRSTGRPSGPMRQRILTLLQDHPEGLSAEEIRVYLKAEKPIGDTLQGMRRNGVVTAQGQGRDMRYFRVFTGNTSPATHGTSGDISIGGRATALQARP